jgi:hypothetical protein
MNSGVKDFWVFRIVHQDTGKPAQGVPVTVLDASSNPAGYWVSEADGTVTIPRREGARLRLRVGLRNEEPIELNTATLRDGPTDLAAPSWVPLSSSTAERGERGERGEREHVATAASRPAEQHEVPGHILYFQRLAMFADPASPLAAGTQDTVADFFSSPTDQSTALRYGVVIEVEQLWQSTGVQWGELLYSVSLTPGDEARLTVLDGRWRRDIEGRERPLQILARMVGTSMLGDLVTALHPELQVESCTLADPDLAAAATGTVRMIRERTERMSQALRRRPLGVVDGSESSDSAAIRTVRNTTRDRVVTFHFFEPLEHFRVVVRSPRIRPVIFVPFRLPRVATAEVVQRFGYIFQRTLLDRSMLPDLDRLLRGEGGGGSGRLLEHVEANLLYYATAIIAVGDHGARHAALAKVRDATGTPLTDLIENTVLGRVGNAIALPLRSLAQLPREWREAVAAYTAHPPRLAEEFNVNVPHPGVWVTAQPHEPMQQTASESAAG